MKDQTITQRIRARISPETRLFVKKNIDFCQSVRKTLNEQDRDIKWLADKIGVSEAQMLDILRGLFDIPMSTITKIETVLGVEIVKIM